MGSPLRDALLGAPVRELRERLAGGRGVAPGALAGWCYRGTSLGLPGWVDRLAWKTFAKCFAAEAGEVRGWNLRLHQGRGLDAVDVIRRRGAPWRFGYFRVTQACRERDPFELPEGAALLDYGAGGNAALDPVSRLRDPLVDLGDGDAETLLGVSWLDLGALRVRTPAFFLLERHGPVEGPRG